MAPPMKPSDADSERAERSRMAHRSGSTSLWYDHAWIMLPLERGYTPLVWVGGRPHLPETAGLIEALRLKMDSPSEAASAYDTINSVVSKFAGG